MHENAIRNCQTKHKKSIIFITLLQFPAHDNLTKTYSLITTAGLRNNWDLFLVDHTESETTNLHSSCAYTSTTKQLFINNGFYDLQRSFSTIVPTIFNDLFLQQFLRSSVALPNQTCVFYLKNKIFIFIFNLWNNFFIKNGVTLQDNMHPSVLNISFLFTGLKQRIHGILWKDYLIILTE